MSDFVIQVSKEHYQKKYDSLSRFISYYYQIDLTLSLHPQSILEIGIGNKTFANYVKQRGINVTTCDFDAELHPDVVADIRHLPFEDAKFDAVTAFEILEHLPWEEVDQALSELRRVAKNNVVISIPYASSQFELIFRFPYIKRFFKKSFVKIFWRIPLLHKKIKFNGQHHWEMGRKGFPISKIRSKLEQYFTIKKETSPVLDSAHYFFVLEKK